MAVRTFPIDFVGGHTPARSKSVMDQRLVNMYLEVEGKGAKAHTVAYSTPGLKKRFSAGNGPCRGDGLFWSRSHQGFVTTGNRIYEVDQNFVARDIGALDDAVARAYFADGFNHFMLTCGDYGYYHDGAAFGKITAPDFPLPSGCAHVDGFFIVSWKGKDEWSISALDDASGWLGTEYAAAEKRGDIIARPMVLNGRPMMIGEYTTEVFANTSNHDFPFEALPSSDFMFGSRGKDSWAESGGAVYGLATAERGGLRVLEISAYGVRNIAPPGLVKLFLSFPTITDAYGFCYEWADHRYYQIAFPAAGRTFEYDATSRRWAERTSGLTRYRGAGHVFMYGVNIVGDYATGDFYELDDATYADAGEVTQRIRRAPVIYAGGAPLFVSRVVMVCEQGVGVANGDGADPKALMRYSSNGGKNFSSWLEAPLGKMGEYGAVTEWWAQFDGIDIVIEVMLSEPVPLTIISAYIEAEAGFNQ